MIGKCRRRCYGNAVVLGWMLLGMSSARADVLSNLIDGAAAVPMWKQAPTLHVTLSRSTFIIHADPKTGEPQMPKDVVARATTQNWPSGAPQPTTFTWHVTLDWDFDAYPTHHAISNETFVQASPLKVNLDEEIRGGVLTVVAHTLLNGQDVCGQAHADVLGENPSHEVLLRAFPRTRFGLIASKIGMAESSLHQFTVANGADPGGLPVASRTNDVGIMQLNAPTGSITSADQIWDWRANVRRGLEMLEAKRRNSFLASRHAIGLRRVQTNCLFQIACLNFARDLLGLPPVDCPQVYPLSDKPGSGIVPGEDDPDKLGLSQWERDAIRRYNGGQEYGFFVTPHPETLDVLEAAWEIDPTRGGVRPSSGDPDYVRHVLRAHSGLTLPPPPHKPTPKQAKHSRYRRHHRTKKHG